MISTHGLKEQPGRLPATFFFELGVFIQPNFLDSQTCARLRGELEDLSSRPSKVVKANGKAEVDLSQRPAKQLGISNTTAEWAEQRLVQVRPDLENYFSQPVHGFETPQFLVYQPGDFHVPHLDKGSKPDEPFYVKSRQFTMVIFLNSEGSPKNESTYIGGALTLYGILDDPLGKKFGFPLFGEEGLLVAFPVSLVHEVTPITCGKRYCIVSHAY